jgi:hypothetical protein
MDVFDFTAEETNLIAIYVSDTRTATIEAITAALPYMDADFTALAKSASRKLVAMSDGGFAAATFTAGEDTEGEGPRWAG